MTRREGNQDGHRGDRGAAAQRMMAIEDRRFAKRGFATAGDLMENAAAFRAATQIAARVISRVNRRGGVQLLAGDAGLYAAEAILAITTRKPRDPNRYVWRVIANLAYRDLLERKLELDPLWAERHDLSKPAREELRERRPELSESQVEAAVAKTVDDLVVRKYAVHQRVLGDERGVGERAAPSTPGEFDLELLSDAMLGVYRTLGVFTAHDRDTFELWSLAEFGTREIPWHMTRFPAQRHAYEQRLSQMLAKLWAALEGLGFDDRGTVIG